MKVGFDVRVSALCLLLAPTVSSTGAAETVADTKFSVNRGFYVIPFRVKISSVTPDAEIRYTTDGSEPALNHGSGGPSPQLVEVTTTTVLRAKAFREGLEPTNVDTQTYLFTNHVLEQPDEIPGYPSLVMRTSGSTSATLDYGMDPEIARDPAYRERLLDGLESIPSISLVLPKEHMFGHGGIYYATDGNGPTHAASVEVLYADEPDASFQVDCGLESHATVAVKRSFKLKFQSEFGRRCCTALAESEIRLWWWPRYVSSMKYPKRCQYKHAKQKKYHVRNWAEYNEGLRRRGDLTVWFDEEAIANWKADKTGKPGGQRVYSDMAIETGLVVRMVYKLAYRQTEGFLHSIASLLGLGIEIPDYSTLCRRSRLLRKKLRIPKAASTQPIHLMIDSTGLRIHVGNARKPPKQRAWRKLHIAVDRETGNIVASELTASRARDATRVPALLTQIQAPLVSVAADSAYDKEAVYEAIEAHSPGRRTRVVIPPQRNATLSQNSNTAMQERDRHIRAIERHGRREWYKLSGYTKRSMVENAVYRYKAIIGPEMRARTLARQRVEHRIGCEILNKMAALGMPDTYCAG